MQQKETEVCVVLSWTDVKNSGTPRNWYCFTLLRFVKGLPVTRGKRSENINSGYILFSSQVLERHKGVARLLALLADRIAKGTSCMHCASCHLKN